MGKGLFVIHLNIRSLSHKIDLLRAWLVYNKPNVITLSETWLNNNILDEEIKLDGYVLYRADRSTRGGGVATYVSSTLLSELISPKENPVYFECLFVKISFHVNKQLIIGNIYRPPNSPSESIQCIGNTIKSVGSSNEMIILGDFNINWLERSSINDRNYIESLNLTQLISEPTRVDHRSKSLLDWILVTHSNRITDSGVLSDCFSDHSMVFCVWKIKLLRLPPKVIRVRQSKYFNTDVFIQDLLDINWNRFNLIPFVEDAWNFLYTEVLKVIDKHAPWISIKVKGRHLPWIDADLLNLFKQRDKAWDKYRRSKDPVDGAVYKQLRNACTTKTRNAKSNYYKNSLSNSLNNPKKFWKSLNALLNKSTKTTPTKIIVNDEVISDPSAVTNAFNQHFSSICSSQFSYSSFSSLVDEPNSSFSFATINPTDVQQAISELKLGNGTDPDGLEIKFIKLASHVLAFPLSDLFNLSLSTSVVPLMWKSARVTPIHKGGDALDLNNYRPISIISSIAKVFEKLVFKQLFKYINEFSILSPNQSGFRPNFSTTTALLKFTNDVSSSLDNNMSTGAIFIDLTKAFDMVDHYLLLDKLYAIGLSRHSLLWFNSYLHCRSQRVYVNGCVSQSLIMEKGVPQGSSLGPLLFSLFINDLPLTCSDCCIHLYADDTVIYTSNKSVSKIQSSLQTNFNTIQLWFQFNHLLLNKKKSYSILFPTRSATQNQVNNLSLRFLDDTQLLQVDELKYLGIWLDSQLSFRCHINSVVKKINCNLRILFRSINCFTQRIRLRIVSQLIFPILDYADVVYQNTSETNLKVLNVIFNNICRFVLRCPFTTHHCEMYDSLKLSLKARRQYHWYQVIFKCVHYDYPSYLKEYLIPYRPSYRLRHTEYFFFTVPNILKESGRRAFKFKAPSEWNSLPGSLRSITSLCSFKTSLFVYLQANCCCKCFPHF